MHRAEDLVTIFNGLFGEKTNTRLVQGGAEPLYLPAGHGASHARIIFAHDYYASALHEISHWCIAGQKRRQLPDYGYWYEPDGRSPQQQKAFARVEARPQALEYIFSRASSHDFIISVDNLDGDPGDYDYFADAVFDAVLDYCRQGLPSRAAQFMQALVNYYQTGFSLDPDNISRVEIKA